MDCPDFGVCNPSVIQPNVRRQATFLNRDTESVVALTPNIGLHILSPTKDFDCHSDRAAKSKARANYEADSLSRSAGYRQCPAPAAHAEITSATTGKDLTIAKVSSHQKSYSDDYEYYGRHRGSLRFRISMRSVRIHASRNHLSPLMMMHDRLHNLSRAPDYDGHDRNQPDSKVGYRSHVFAFLSGRARQQSTDD
jgi:hypothetical protein